MVDARVDERLRVVVVLIDRFQSRQQRLVLRDSCVQVALRLADQLLLLLPLTLQRKKLHSEVRNLSLNQGIHLGGFAAHVLLHRRQLL